MTSLSRRCTLALILTLLVVAVPDAAYAYGGPGSVISGIGALLAAVAAIVASVFGFLWYPLKRLLRSTNDAPDEETQ